MTNPCYNSFIKSEVRDFTDRPSYSSEPSNLDRLAQRDKLIAEWEQSDFCDNIGNNLDLD
jgi:hypothetical protein